MEHALPSPLPPRMPLRWKRSAGATPSPLSLRPLQATALRAAARPVLAAPTEAGAAEPPRRDERPPFDDEAEFLRRLREAGL